MERTPMAGKRCELMLNSFPPSAPLLSTTHLSHAFGGLAGRKLKTSRSNRGLSLRSMRSPTEHRNWVWLWLDRLPGEGVGLPGVPLGG